MSRYRRSLVAGGTFFFTVTLAERYSTALIDNIHRLSAVYGRVQREHPFETVAICVLPDHLHAVWALPAEDADFSLRWSLIKAGFSRGLAVSTRRSASKAVKRVRKVFGSDDFGSTKFATIWTCSGMWITFISTRLSMVMWSGWRIGRIHRFIVMWRAVFIRQIGRVVKVICRVSVNKEAGVGWAGFICPRGQ